MFSQTQNASKYITTNMCSRLWLWTLLATLGTSRQYLVGPPSKLPQFFMSYIQKYAWNISKRSRSRWRNHTLLVCCSCLSFFYNKKRTVSVSLFVWVYLLWPCHHCRSQSFVWVQRVNVCILDKSESWLCPLSQFAGQAEWRTDKDPKCRQMWVSFSAGGWHKTKSESGKKQN